jgi:hypothetical protein
MVRNKVNRDCERASTDVNDSLRGCRFSFAVRLHARHGINEQKRKRIAWTLLVSWLDREHSRGE